MAENKDTTVHINPGNVYTFEWKDASHTQGHVQPMISTGTTAVGYQMVEDASRQAGAETKYLFDLNPSALTGAEKGLERLENYPKSAPIAAGIAGAARIVVEANNVAQHLADGRMREVAIEAIGMAGHAAGGIGGAELGAALFARLSPAASALSAVLGGAGGADLVGETFKAGARQFTAPEPLPPDLKLEPTVVIGEAKFALVNVEGSYVWYNINEDLNLYPRYIAVVPADTLHALTDTYIKALYTPEKYAEFQQELYEREMYGGSTRAEIEARIKPIGELVTEGSPTVSPLSEPKTPQEHVAEGNAPNGEPLNQLLPENAEYSGRHIWALTDEGTLILSLEQGTVVVEIEYSGDGFQQTRMVVHDNALGKSTVVFDHRESNQPEIMRAETDTVSYVVEHGETLSQIAERHGTTVETLLELNPDIENRNLIFQDQEINLPTSGLARGPSPNSPEWQADNVVTYAVQPGDSLWKIAQETGVPFDQVLAANQHLENPTQISLGQKVNIPATFVDSDGFINAAITVSDSVVTASARSGTPYRTGTTNPG